MAFLAFYNICWDPPTNSCFTRLINCVQNSYIIFQLIDCIFGESIAFSVKYMFFSVSYALVMFISFSSFLFMFQLTYPHPASLNKTPLHTFFFVVSVFQMFVGERGRGGRRARGEGGRRGN